MDAKLNKLISPNFDLFMSYCGENKKNLHELYEELAKRGHNIWIDKNEMIVGDTDELMQKGIDQSQLFMCCATTNYCASESCLLEFRYAVRKKKKIIYILFEKFNGEDDRLDKLHAISFRFAGQKYYKHDNVDGIVKAIEELNREQSNVNSPKSANNEEELIPCEFCNKLFKIQEFDLHQRRCAGQLHQKEVGRISEATNDMILMENQIMGKRVKSIKTWEINNASVLHRMALFNNGLIY